MKPEVRERILAAAASEPAPTRATVLLRSTLLLAGALAVALAIFFRIGGVRVTGRPLLLIAQTALGAALVAALAAWLALGRGRSMLGRPRSWLLGTVVVAPLVLLALKIAITAAWPGMSDLCRDRMGLKCLGWSLLISVAPLLALLLIRRGSDPVRPVATGAAIGLSVSAFTWVLVDLWCPVAYPRHLLLGHVLPLVLITAAGALVGSKTLKTPDPR